MSLRHFIKHLECKMKILPYSSHLSSYPPSFIANLSPFSSSSYDNGQHSTKPNRIYASLFCTLIELFLACNRLSKATEAFLAMRELGNVPGLASWNRLLCEFNASGLLSQVWVISYNS